MKIWSNQSKWIEFNLLTRKISHIVYFWPIMTVFNIWFKLGILVIKSIKNQLLSHSLWLFEFLRFQNCYFRGLTSDCFQIIFCWKCCDEKWNQKYKRQIYQLLFLSIRQNILDKNKKLKAIIWTWQKQTQDFLENSCS